MLNTLLRATILAGALAITSAAFAQMMPAKVGETSKGKTLMDMKGMTLYVFDKDAAGKSNCNGTCARSPR